ncbi:MAG: hypothetical protein ACRDZ5_06640 [Acidimicrobiales bacterium]
MVSVSPVLLGAAVFAVVCGALVLGAGIVVWRRMRRRWRALTSHAGVRAAIAMARLAHAGTGRNRRAARLRCELWQGVWAATRALRGAECAGGVTADLPALCRRLRSSAQEVDRLLVMASGLPPEQCAPLERQLAAVLEASRSIRAAALASAGGAASARSGSLADDADREARAVAAGVARSRELLG